MTREPDRFDAKAKELCQIEWERIAAALRAEHASALERAREAIMPLHGPTIADAVARIDFLLDEVKPAAAPAADPHAPYCCADAKAGGPDHSMDCPHFAIPPAPDLRGALVEAKDALEQVWAAIGDRLCGKGPLSKEYAHGVTQKVNVALAQIRFTLSIAAAPAADYDPITAPIPEGDMNGPHGPMPAAETRMEKLLRVAGVRVLVEPCEIGGHYRNENGVTFHPSKCAAPPDGEGK